MGQGALPGEQRFKAGLLVVDLVLHGEQAGDRAGVARAGLRSWLMAAWAEVTRLVTSATVWVTSWACCDMASLVPSWVDSAPSVAG